MLDNDKGIVYGLVGVIGSGKSYRAEQLCADAVVDERKVIMGDFSDGIRQTVMNILAGEDVPIDVNSREYLYWKNNDFTVHIPGRADMTVNGRLLLQRTGEFLKQLAGPAVWANWTGKQVTKKWIDLPNKESYRADIVFGSVRFLEEVETVFRVGKMTSKQVKFIFCNYRSDTYELNDHVSEALARRFVERGFKDGDDITSQLHQILRDERIS